MLCSQLRSELNRIKSLKRDFDLEFEKASKTRKTQTAEELKDQLAQLAKALSEKLEPLTDRLTLKRAKELLGPENVHGQEDVEFLLGWKLNPKDIPPIPYTKADFKKSREIKEKTGIQEMLVLFVKDWDGAPLTGERLNVLIQMKYDEMELGKFLYGTDWYQNEAFYQTLGLKPEWKLITKQCIPNSKSKYHHFKKGDDYNHEDTQEYAIEQYAETIGIPRNKLNRPEPFQMLTAVALHLTATERDKGKGKGERLFLNEYHWSDTRFSNGDFVYFGNANARGVEVEGGYRQRMDGRLAVYLSRDAGEGSREVVE